MSHGFRTICNGKRDVSRAIVERQGRETYREENMASRRSRKRENHTPTTASHPPTDRDQRKAQNDHSRNQNPRDSQGKPILLQDLGYFFEEVTLLHLLNGGAPSNVV